jgi:hypothetical protein
MNIFSILNIDVINKVCNHLSSIDSVNFLRAINLYGKYYEEQIDRLIVDYKYSIRQHEKATQCSECDDIVLCYSCKTGSQNMCEFCNKFLCADCSLFTSDELCISDIFMGNKVCLECLIEYAKKNNRVCAGCNKPFFQYEGYVCVGTCIGCKHRFCNYCGPHNIYKKLCDSDSMCEKIVCIKCALKVDNYEHSCDRDYEL